MALYNGTITVGSYAGTYYGYTRPGNLVGIDPIGSVVLDPGAPTVDRFIWTADGSVAILVFLGSVPSATWNGQEYPLTYDPDQGVSYFYAYGLGGPYPTSGTTTFTLDDGVSSGTAYTLSLAVQDVTVTRESVALVAGAVLPLGTRDVSVASTEVTFSSTDAAALSLETLSVSVTSEDLLLARGYELYLQGKFVAPLFQDLNLLSTTNTTNTLDMQGLDVTLLVYPNGMFFPVGKNLPIDTYDVPLALGAMTFPSFFPGNRQPRGRGFIL